MNNGKALFSPLAKAKKGMAIYMTDFKKIYEYKMDDLFIAEPTQVEVIDNQGSKKMVTPVTCNYEGSKRMIIQGELVEKKIVATVVRGKYLTSSKTSISGGIRRLNQDKEPS